MKTNQNMIRKMGNFDVTQRTKDGMFNATGLLKQWNNFSGQQKQMIHFTELKSTQEYIDTIEEDQVSKERNHVLIKARGKNGGTWMHPYLFIDFAMWINPKFKLQVIKFVYDELIQNRHLAGDYYPALMTSLAQFGKIKYGEIGKILNYVVFNEHNKALRNTGTPEQLNELQQLERDVCKYVDLGFIRSYEDFKRIMRKEWHKRHGAIPQALAS